jgi:hypothetical protein
MIVQRSRSISKTKTKDLITLNQKILKTPMATNVEIEEFEYVINAPAPNHHYTEEDLLEETKELKVFPNAR